MSSVEVIGEKELIDKLAKMIGRADGASMVAVMGGASEMVRRSIQSYAPTMTGELRDSISIVIVPRRNAVESHIGTDVFYARFQERGTRKMSAHPYLRPGLTASESEAKRKIIADLKARVIKP